MMISLHLPRRYRRPLAGSLTVVIVTALAGLLIHRPPSSVSAQPPLALAQRPDGQQQAYYVAGDENLVTGFELLQDYWSTLAASDGALLRGHVDNYLPLEIKPLDYRPADVLMADFARRFFAARHPQTGLIPYAYETELIDVPGQGTKAATTANKQPVGLISRAVEFCRWFPEDAHLQTQCAELAQSTLEHFDVPARSEQPSGLWGWVDVESGAAPRSALTLTQDYGQVAQGLAYVAQATKQPRFLSWANQKLQFVWQHRMDDSLPLLYEQFVLTHALERPEEPSSDTDTLYYVRQLFDLYEATGDPQYRDWAMAVTDLWVDQAWMPDWGHFVRKLNPDGTPAVDTLYGDGKYNTLYILIQAYTVTNDPAYLQQLKLAWHNLSRMGQNGLAPEAVQRGRMVQTEGLDSQQTFFLDILVEAFQASGDPELLQAATRLAAQIRKRGPAVMRTESGQAGTAFLKLALAHHPVGRLELTFDQPNTQLEIYRNNSSILLAPVPTQTAVVYLPEGAYDLTVRGQGRQHSGSIQLAGHMQIQMP